MKENFIIVHSLNLIRLWNLFINKLSFLLTKIFNRPIVFGYPYVYSIEPTTFCNLQCSECISGQRSFTRNTGFMKCNRYKDLLRKINKYAIYLMLNFQGEPFLHPDIFCFIKQAKKKKIFVSISTNGHFLGIDNCEKLIKSGLDRLIVSLDGLSQETYEKYRKGGDFSKVEKGIKQLVATKKRLNATNPFIELQFIAFKSNEHEMPLLESFKKSLGVNKVAIKTAQFTDLNHAMKLLPNDEKLCRYTIDNDNLILNREQSKPCPRLWSTSVLTQNGEMLPCCFDKDASYSYGNLSDRGALQDIWKSNKVKKFRRVQVIDPDKISMCSNCDLGVKIYKKNNKKRN
ncbi:radical SAM protein [Bacteroidales bacterium]|nr:radical SAM protein [Bacteroidales bacterium]